MMFSNLRDNIWRLAHRGLKHGFRAKIVKVPPALLSLVYIEPTNRCTLRCTHCAQSANLTRPRGFMDWELYKKIVDDLRPVREHVILALHKQGEPTLHPRIVDMIRYGKEAGFFVKMNTNATVLAPSKAAAIIEAGIDEIVFPSSGTTKEGYERIHRQGIYDKVMANIIGYFLELRKAGRENSVQTELCFVKRPYTPPQEVETLFEFYSHLPFDCLDIFNIINFFGDTDEGDALIWSQLDTPYEEIEPARFPICTMPWKDMSVNWDGSVPACPFDYDNVYVLGNARQDNMLELWNHERMIQFRKALAERDYQRNEGSRKLCSNCSIPWAETPLGYQTPWQRGFRKLRRSLGRLFSLKTSPADELRLDISELKERNYRFIVENFGTSSRKELREVLKKVGQTGRWGG